MRYCLVIILLSTLQVSAQVRVLTVDNQTKTGQLVALTAQPPTIVLQTCHGKEKLSCLDIVEIEFVQAKFQPTPATQIIFNDRSVIYGRISGGSPINLSILSPSLGTFIVELEKIRTIIFTKHDNHQEVRLPENDVFYLRSGDHLRGVIDSFSKNAVHFEHDQLGLMDLPFEKLERITFAKLGPLPTPPVDFVAIVICRDHSRLTGKIMGLSMGMLRIAPTYLADQIEIPLPNIKSIHFRNGRFIYLSDLPAKLYSIKVIPYFPGDRFPAKLDRNQLGGPLRLKGKQYLKGVGVYARTEITVKLQGRYQRFQSFAGIDDQARQFIQANPYAMGGCVEFLVYLDGVKQFSSKLVSLDSPLVKIDLPVKGVQEMKLVVDYGDYAHCNDLADWAGARLVK